MTISLTQNQSYSTDNFLLGGAQSWQIFSPNISTPSDGILLWVVTENNSASVSAPTVTAQLGTFIIPFFGGAGQLGFTASFSAFGTGSYSGTLYNCAFFVLPFPVGANWGGYIEIDVPSFPININFSSPPDGVVAFCTGISGSILPKNIFMDRGVNGGSCVFSAAGTVGGPAPALNYGTLCFNDIVFEANFGDNGSILTPKGFDAGVLCYEHIFPNSFVQLTINTQELSTAIGTQQLNWQGETNANVFLISLTDLSGTGGSTSFQQLKSVFPYGKLLTGLVGMQ
jgi:hypothetical protein